MPLPAVFSHKPDGVARPSSGRNSMSPYLLKTITSPSQSSPAAPASMAMSSMLQYSSGSRDSVRSPKSPPSHTEKARLARNALKFPKRGSAANSQPEISLCGATIDLNVDTSILQPELDPKVRGLCMHQRVSSPVLCALSPLTNGHVQVRAVQDKMQNQLKGKTKFQMLVRARHFFCVASSNRSSTRDLAAFDHHTTTPSHHCRTTTPPHGHTIAARICRTAETPLPRYQSPISTLMTCCVGPTRQEEHVLDRSAFSRTLKRHGLELADDEIGILFDHYDRDKGGTLDYEEFFKGLRGSEYVQVCLQPPV